jgi:hypothetical protein
MLSTQLDPQDYLINADNLTTTGPSSNIMQSTASLVRKKSSKIIIHAGMALSIVTPTLMPSLINYPKAETLIENPKFYTLSTYEPISITDQLNNNFALTNEHETVLYLQKHTDLLAYLDQISNKLRTYSDIQSITLEHYKDIEEHWEKLYISANTNNDDMDKLDALEDKIYEEIFDLLPSIAKGHLVISVS